MFLLDLMFGKTRILGHVAANTRKSNMSRGETVSERLVRKKQLGYSAVFSSYSLSKVSNVNNRENIL